MPLVVGLIIIRIPKLGGPAMSFRTKAIGVGFLLVLVVLSIIVDLMDWSTWVLAAPAIILEIAFFISAMADDSKD